MKPDCSIIVVNKDDRGIADTLQALVRLPAVVRGEAEVIVVDASQGRLSDLAERFAAARWLEFRPIPGRVTIAHQRNAGIRASRGEIVAFIDASCVPAPSWLERLLKPLEMEDETVVAGSHRSAGGRGLRDQATRRMLDHRYLREAPTINVALRRTVLDSVGQFDEAFDYGSDVDYFWRAVDAGHRIRYLPEAEVTHQWGGASAEARRSYVYGQARARLYLKHRRRWRGLLGPDIQTLVYPAYILLTPLAIRRPYVHLVLAVPLWRNRGLRPILTVADHFLYGAGVLREVASAALGQPGRRRPAPARLRLAVSPSSSIAE